MILWKEREEKEGWQHMGGKVSRRTVLIGGATAIGTASIPAGAEAAIASAPAPSKLAAPTFEECHSAYRGMFAQLRRLEARLHDVVKTYLLENDRGNITPEDALWLYDIWLQETQPSQPFSRAWSITDRQMRRIRGFAKRGLVEIGRVDHRMHITLTGEGRKIASIIDRATEGHMFSLRLFGPSPDGLAQASAALAALDQRWFDYIRYRC